MPDILADKKQKADWSAYIADLNQLVALQASGNGASLDELKFLAQKGAETYPHAISETAKIESWLATPTLMKID